MKCDTVIESSVTTIGTCSFDGMNSLKDITIHDKITTIGNYAFRNSGLITINLNKVKSIGESSFESCSKLTTVTLSQSSEFTTIPTKAFTSCIELQQITIPSNIQTISNNAFNGCSKLSSVTFAEGLQTIREYSFESTLISTLSIPSTVTSIGLYAFRHCNSLQTISVTEGNTKYSVETQGGLIEKTSETETTLVLYPKQKTTENNVYIIPSEVTTIGGYAFYQHPSFIFVRFNEKVEKIGEYSFNGMKLKSVTMPNTLTRLGDYAFDGCTTLRLVVLVGKATERKVICGTSSLPILQLT